MDQISSHDEQVVESTERIAAMEEELKKVFEGLFVFYLHNGQMNAGWIPGVLPYLYQTVT